jgi:hypothetical protein
MNKRQSHRSSTARARDLARIDRYIDLFNRQIAARETDDPQWRSRALLLVIDNALGVLAQGLREGKHVRWDKPFWAFQYPVEWDWDQWQWNRTELAIRYGQLSSANTRTRQRAVRVLAEMSVREQIYATLHHFTHEVSTYKRGRYQHPMMPEPLAESVRSLATGRARQKALEELFAPFSIGAAEVDWPQGLKPNQKIPRRLTEQLARQTRDLREIAIPMTSDGHAIVVRVIFQVFPLTIDEGLKRAYFPITIGLVVAAQEPVTGDYRRPPKWLDPKQWSARDHQRLWQALSQIIHHSIQSMKPVAKNEVTQEIQKVTARMEIEMEATSPEDVERSATQVLDGLRKRGFLKNYKLHPSASSAASKETVQVLLKAVETAQDTTSKGAALENLLTCLLKAVPEFEVQKGVRTMTEEIDVKVLNSHGDPRWRSTPIILFECKNWSKVCGKNEVVLFERKLENRRGRALLGFLVSWRGFAKTVRQELLRGSRGQIQVALLTGDDLRAAAETGNILPVLRSAVDCADET